MNTLSTIQRIIFTITLLIIITALSYFIGGRNALIYLTVAFLFTAIHCVRKWWNKKYQQRIERKVQKQLTQAPERTSFPTIPGMKNPLQEDLERENQIQKASENDSFGACL